jgi:uncharacterized coiled-coil protein SlyX
MATTSKLRRRATIPTAANAPAGPSRPAMAAQRRQLLASITDSHGALERRVAELEANLRAREQQIAELRTTLERWRAGSQEAYQKLDMVHEQLGWSINFGQRLLEKIAGMKLITHEFAMPDAVAYVQGEMADANARLAEIETRYRPADPGKAEPAEPVLEAVG